MCPEVARADSEAGSVSGSGPADTLQLEVFINTVPSHLISSFRLLPDGTLGAQRSELEELGLVFAEGPLATRSFIRLDDVPTLDYDYQERTQRLLIRVDPAQLSPQHFDLRPDSGSVRPQRPTQWGGVLNYDLLGTRSTVEDVGWSTLGGSSLTLDARIFSPEGTLQQSGLVLLQAHLGAQFVRLDTSYRDSNPDKLLSWSLGDTIEGSLPWSRPIRIGGVQLQTNFMLRPDLVTMPLPSLGGIAAVPSTVDLYVNNVRTFSQQVAPGPFSVSNIPVVSGGGAVSLIMRDASGQEIRSSLPLYASTTLLASGLQSWSIEAGFPRLGYGTTEGTYLSVPVGSATWRAGCLDWLTTEAHVEGGAGVGNGGAGVAVNLRSIGVISAALSGSRSNTARGAQLYAAFETRLSNLTFNTIFQHSYAGYQDLASATARLSNVSFNQADIQNGAATNAPGDRPSPTLAAFYDSALPARVLASFSLSAPLLGDAASTLGLNYIHLIDGSGNRSDPVTLSYSRSLPWGASLVISGFRDRDNKSNTGFGIGVSFPFGASVAGSSRYYSGPQGGATTVEATKTLGPSAGDVGWRVRDSLGIDPFREAVLSYRSSVGVLDVGANQGTNGSSALLQLRGAVSTMAGGVFYSDRIEDAFAVVHTGMPGIEVSNSNQVIGVTNSRGMLLVPTLQSYRINQIAIDPRDLPVDSELATSRELVAPADRSGVLVSFPIRTEQTAALVEFLRNDGTPLPPGSSGRIDGGDDFVVGYDGQAFIRHLRATNVAHIDFGRATCLARFDFAPRSREQVRINAVICEAGTPRQPPANEPSIP